MGFTDIFDAVKQLETENALTALPPLLSSLDVLYEDALIDELISNILAGNMYDW
jgi:hypothetical protein